MNKIELTPKQEKEIIEFWKNSKDNRVCVLAKVLGYTRHTINTVINNYLKSLTK